MRTKKPAGWPKYMICSRLKNGIEAYYWKAPNWARYHQTNPIKITSEALGSDYATAKLRCDDFLNPMLDEWKITKNFTVDELQSYLEEKQHNIIVGSFRWLTINFIKTKDYKKLSESTKKDYKNDLERICSYRLKKDPQKRTFGQLMLQSIDANAADRILEELSRKPDGTPIKRKAYQCMQAARRAWNVGKRRWPKYVPNSNPFAKTGMSKPTGGESRPATREQLAIFMDTADKMGHSSMALSALIAWEFMIRQTDLIKYVTWSRYRPKDNPDCFEVIHNKNQDRPLLLPLENKQGELLFSELEERIRKTEKRGPSIIMKDIADKNTGEYAPYTYDQFNARANDIIKASKLQGISFSSFRKGGETEMGDADLTDSQILALDGHKTRDMLTVYVAKTKKQSIKGQEKRLKLRRES